MIVTKQLTRPPRRDWTLEVSAQSVIANAYDHKLYSPTVSIWHFYLQFLSVKLFYGKFAFAQFASMGRGMQEIGYQNTLDGLGNVFGTKMAKMLQNGFHGQLTPGWHPCGQSPKDSCLQFKSWSTPLLWLEILI